MGRELFATLVAHLRFHASHEVVAQLASDEFMKVDSIGRVGGMDKAIAVNREVEQQGGIVAYAAVVEIGELLGRFHLTIFFGVIEPSWTYRHVTLGWRPLVTIGITILKFGIIGIAWINTTFGKERPVGFARKAFLIAHPATARTTIAKHYGIGLYAIKHLVDVRIIVIGFAVDGAFITSTTIVAVATIGTVEPHLKHRTVMGKEVAQLSIEIGEIGGRAIVGARAVPRREIDGKLKAVLLTSL